jgi:hypothetical protein
MKQTVKFVKLTKAVARELKGEYARIKLDSDAAYEKWSALQVRVRALETILESAGFKIKPKDEEVKQKTEKIIGRVSKLRLAIAEVLKAEGKAIKASVLRDKLRNQQVNFRPAYFWRIISRMEGKGMIKRVGPGMYELVNGTS